MKRNLAAFFFCLTVSACTIANAGEPGSDGVNALNPPQIYSLNPADAPQVFLGDASASCAQDCLGARNDSLREAANAVGPDSTGKKDALIEAVSPLAYACLKQLPEDNHYLDSDWANLSSVSACSPDAHDPSSDYTIALNDMIFGMAESGALEAAASEEGSIPGVPVVVNKNVDSFIRYFQTRGRKYFVRWLGRSQYYMAMLKGTLRENGLPEDLSYIAFIESGLNPTARSRSNAVGMWQFIKGTAKKYGLRVDWWIDERMDPEKATKAAAMYFKNLYGQFGSWYLAAASYNAGEGRVMKAMKKHGSEDFWVLANYKKPLKRETKEYVPKYLAAMLIAKDPKFFGFDEQEVSEEGLVYDRVKIRQATDINIIAQAAGTSTEEIRRLNPELLRWFTPPNYPDYEIKLPAGSAKQFEENFDKIPAPARVAFRMHKVRRGETLSKIAKKYGVQVKPVMYLNNLKTMKRLKPGTVIAIPVRATGKNSSEIAEVLTYWKFQS